MSGSDIKVDITYQLTIDGYIYVFTYYEYGEEWIKNSISFQESFVDCYENYDLADFEKRNGWYHLKDDLDEGTLRKYCTGNSLDYKMKFKYEDKHITEIVISIKDRETLGIIETTLDFSEFNKIEIIIPDEVLNARELRI